MKALVQDTYGGPDVLEFRDVEPPNVGDDEVLVRVHAASVNAADGHLLRGTPYLVRLAYGLSKPRKVVLGRDVAGRVEAVGKSVTELRPSDEVYAEVDGGAFAEYICVPQNMLALKPSNLTFEQAAAVPLAANTALQGLRDRGRLQPGQRVLVNGASGGVGTFAVQLAKAFGAEVTGVCSTRNVDLVGSIGADQVVDYTREDFTQRGQRYDLIFDLVGNHSLSEYRRTLTSSGTLVLSGGAGSRWVGPIGRILKALVLSPFVRQKLRPFVAKRSKENLGVLRNLVETGKITPTIDRTYPLSETPEAIRYLEQEHARAKIVITV